MLREFKKRTEKTGLPPGTPLPVGEGLIQETKIIVMVYDQELIEEKVVKNIPEILPLLTSSKVTWIDVTGISQLDIINDLGTSFNFHPLVLEDIVAMDQRPKIEEFEEYIFSVLRLVKYSEKIREIETKQISFILGSNYLISIHEEETNTFQPIRERLHTNKGIIRKMGVDYLFYSLLDAVVDKYFIILEALDTRLENLEDEVIEEPTPGTLQHIHHLKGEMITLRKSIWPLREVIGRLERSTSALIKDTTDRYLRDLYDHTIRVIETVETFRDLLSGLFDIYLSSVSNRMNEIMKVLTIIATIFIPLTLIVGVYGMNFQFMPELGIPWAYPMVWFSMLLISLLMVIYFRKKRWL